jgi:8-oxo-dGTP diphosphatase
MEAKLMIKYNLGLIRQGTRILLLNREKSSWMGCWNGVGGKMEPGESPRAAMLREIFEETGMDSFEKLRFTGLLTWSTTEGTGFGGGYLYLAEIAQEDEYPTPVKTEEGILDWKEFDWIFHPDNVGLASNIPHCLDKALHDKACYNHHSVYEGNKLVEVKSTIIDPAIEEDEKLREQYLQRFVATFVK